MNICTQGPAEAVTNCFYVHEEIKYLSRLLLGRSLAVLSVGGASEIFF
jgi:hypothetical protein